MAEMPEMDPLENAMAVEYLGKAVSIECEPRLGIFQGIIKEITPSKITIKHAFRNGVPLRKPDAELSLRSDDINNIRLLPIILDPSLIVPVVTSFLSPDSSDDVSSPTGEETLRRLLLTGVNSPPPGLSPGISPPEVSPPEILSPCSSQASLSGQQSSSLNGGSNKSSPSLNNVPQYYGNMIPAKVEALMGSASQAAVRMTQSTTVSVQTTLEGSPRTAFNIPMGCPKYVAAHDQGTNFTSLAYAAELFPEPAAFGNGGMATWKPKSYYRNGNGSNGQNRKAQRRSRRETYRQQETTFETAANDPQFCEDFDFEGNLALFDKQALWTHLETEPESVQPAATVQKYRHDENILVSEPPQFQQIDSMFESSANFVTDEGLIIPTIPTFVRAKLETLVAKAGFTLQRQFDVLARGAADLAIMLCGGARRFIPTNSHQWPVVVVLCEKSSTLRTLNVGATVGRILASHGLRVLLYSEEDAQVELKCNELQLFKATGNAIVYNVKKLPKPDLAIVSSNTVYLSPDVTVWLKENRAPIVAVDPPPSGIRDVSIKHSIVPILPLNGISPNKCGKLYLCNLGIPDQVFRDAGIKYKSPFGHKYVIPIHLKD